MSPLSLSGAPLGPKRISIILNQVRVPKSIDIKKSHVGQKLSKISVLVDSF